MEKQRMMNGATDDDDEYERSDEERGFGGIEAVLFMKLVCRHGKHIPQNSFSSAARRFERKQADIHS